MNAQVFTLAFLACIAFATSAAVSRSLQSDFKDFDNLLPKEAIKEVVATYVQSNEDVQAAVAYAQTDDFKTEYRKILRLTVVRNVVDYLQLAGVNAVEFLDKLADLLGLEPYTPPKEGISEDCKFVALEKS
jgi:Na+-translocating ferredoxin:NAD+ oxidoreductase RnfG subunit